MVDKIITYVYDDREVILTGRMATAPSGSKLPTKIEIVPVGSDPNDKTYSRWVNMIDLLLVTNLEDEQDDIE